MSETINTYLLSDPETVIPMNRKEFYAEQVKEYKKNGKPSRAAGIVSIFIFNPAGEILVQKRSYDKKHNPGLFDKTIGGHIRYGDTPDYTVMVETVQELQTPSIVLKNLEDFKKTHDLLLDYLETIGIIRHSGTDIFNLRRKMYGEDIVIANKAHLYFGVYDGRTRPVDKEAQGVLYYSLEHLREEMKKLPEAFTGDMHFFMEKFGADMDDFVEMIKSK